MLKPIKLILLLLLILNVKSFAKEEALKVDTWEDAILWMGTGMPENFDPNTIEDKQNTIRLALKECEKMANDNDELAMELLASYYFHFKKNTRKSLYWAHKSAECGSSTSMVLLMKAYYEGNGVIKDCHESFKWMHLAAARGNELAKEAIMNIEKEFPDAEQTKEVRKSAMEWQKAHPKAFFSP